MSSPVEQIKERLSIYDVVSAYIKLVKAGRNFKACCPFHNEKTPSFFVSPERETFHCFGCDRGGDIFGFIEEIEGVQFQGALRVLAERAGVTLERVSSGAARERERLLGVLEEAATYYVGELSNRADVLSYLSKRGLTSSIITSFRVGYAPNDWNVTSSFLQTCGFHEKELLRAGITATSGGRSYDRFRGRIMFPITDSVGKVIAFTGRVFDDTSGKSAKYINSPETELFHKSDVLYGFDKAKSAIRQKETALIVEGQVDVIMSHQAGEVQAIATSGTALSDGHLLRIKRIAKKIIFAFDADEAGVSASARGVDKALAHGFDVSLISLPNGKDPADVIAEDTRKWPQLLNESRHVVEFFLTTLASKGYDKRTFRNKVEEVVLPYIAIVRSPIDKAHFVSRVAEELSLSDGPVWDALRIIESQKGNTLEKNKVPNKTERRVATERRDKIRERLVSLFAWQRSLGKPKININEGEKEFERLVGSNAKEEFALWDTKEKARALFEAELLYGTRDELSQEIKELLVGLEEELLKKRLEQSILNLKEAERVCNIKKVDEYVATYSLLTKELNEIMKKRHSF